MKILAFAASTSSQSINRRLVEYAAGLIEGADIEYVDLNDYEMPIYSSDREGAGGIPEFAQQFYEKIGAADGLLISFAEHNGNYTAAYKNLFDWVSRIDQKVFQSKPSVLLATSPGKGGAVTVLKMAEASAPHFGMEVKAAVSVPSFYDTFDSESGQMRNEEIRMQLKAAVSHLAA